MSEEKQPALVSRYGVGVGWFGLQKVVQSLSLGEGIGFKKRDLGIKDRFGLRCGLLGFRVFVGW